MSAISVTLPPSATALSTPVASATELVSKTPDPTGAKLAFPAAAPPDIIRSNQKDAFYRNALQEQVTETYRQYFGTRSQHENQEKLNIVSDLCYFGLTTVLGTQTLGEEYCDILQVHAKGRKFPRIARRTGLITARILAPYVYLKASAQFVRRTSALFGPIELNDNTDEMQRISKHRWRMHLSLWASWIGSFIQEYGTCLHLAMFYFFGAYYHWSNRLTGIRYIFTRRLQPGEERQGYEILGVLLLVRIFMQGIIGRFREKKELANEGVLFENRTDPEDSSLDHPSTSITRPKCTLCLEPRFQTASTPCGHLFCWTCISEWCRNKPECPLCRQPAHLPHLFPVYHYD